MYESTSPSCLAFDNTKRTRLNADDIERAAYIAAHAILTTNLQAPELACPGARRSYTVDAIAEVIKGVFALDYEGPDASLVWSEAQRAASARRRRPSQGQKILHAHADTAVRLAW
jgi:hypothetical protein